MTHIMGMTGRRVHYEGRDIRVSHRKNGLRNVYLLFVDDEPVEPSNPFNDEFEALRFAKALIDDE